MRFLVNSGSIISLLPCISVARRLNVQLPQLMATNQLPIWTYGQRMIKLDLGLSWAIWLHGRSSSQPPSSELPPEPSSSQPAEQAPTDQPITALPNLLKRRVSFPSSPTKVIKGGGGGGFLWQPLQDLQRKLRDDRSRLCNCAWTWSSKNIKTSVRLRLVWPHALRGVHTITPAPVHCQRIRN